jgi:hypothetical protein
MSAVVASSAAARERLPDHCGYRSFRMPVQPPIAPRTCLDALEARIHQQRPATPEATLTLNPEPDNQAIAGGGVSGMNGAAFDAHTQSKKGVVAYQRPADPAERIHSMRCFYQGWRPTRLHKS